MSKNEHTGGYSGTKDAADMAPPPSDSASNVRVLAPTMRASVHIGGLDAAVTVDVEGPHRVVERVIAAAAHAVVEEVER